MKTTSLKLAVISILIVIGFGIWRQFSTKEDAVISVVKKESSSIVPSATNVSNNFQKKLLALQTFLIDHPQDTTHLMLIARLYQDAHQPKQAVLYYKRLIDIQQKNPQHWLDYITVLAESNDWKTAEETCLTMLSYFKDNSSARYNLGAIYANQGKMDEAEQIWTALAKQPEIDAHVKHLVESALNQLNRTK